MERLLALSGWRKPTALWAAQLAVAARNLTSTSTPSSSSSSPSSSSPPPQSSEDAVLPRFPRKKSRHSRRPRRDAGKRKSTAEARRSPRDSATADAFSDPHNLKGAAVPQSLDIGEVEAFMDVEKFFPAAMTHLRAAPPSSSHVADERDKRRWRDLTHDYDHDGVRRPDRTEEATEYRSDPSFFSQGSLDIRGSMAFDAEGRPRATSGAPTEAEALSPDILQLTGGDPRRNRPHTLATRSNDAPADQTIDGDGPMAADGEGGSEFGDTPVQVTDMLRERLMELKAEKLREERSDTFMPRRLPLLSDAEIAAREARRQQQQQQQQLRLGMPSSETGELQRAKPTKPTSRAPSAAVATLGDWADNDDLDEGGSGGTSASAVVPAIRRDGYSEEQTRSAASVLGSAATAFTPAGVADDDLFAELDTALRRRRDPFDPESPSGSDEAMSGAVALLRTLPRAGFCSRREALVIIAGGEVKVNNVVERNPFRLVRAEDDIHVAGHPSRLRFAPPRLYMYHKPANVMVARSDPHGRRLITRHAQILGLDHLIPVGSLPMRAHGVLMLTNDGELAQFLENPASNIQQTYLLRVRPAIDPTLAHKLNTRGININGRQHRGFEFIVNPTMRSRYTVKVKTRGETMSVAHAMQHLGRVVERGGRISFGPFALGSLAVGSVRQVTIPPAYVQQERLGAVWKPFVERDWPYFRRQRAQRLRRLSQYRELTPAELEELDSYTYDEVHDALSFDRRELDEAARAHHEAFARRPEVGEPIPFPFGRPGADEGSEARVNPADVAVPFDDDIVEDITTIH